MLTIGEGQSTCAEWTEAKRTKSGDRAVYREWLYGFLTGVDLAHSGLRSKPLLSDWDNPQTMLAIADEYCAQNPTEYIATASQHVLAKLFEREKASP